MADGTERGMRFNPLEEPGRPVRRLQWIRDRLACADPSLDVEGNVYLTLADRDHLVAALTRSIEGLPADD